MNLILNHLITFLFKGGTMLKSILTFLSMLLILTSCSSDSTVVQFEPPEDLITWLQTNISADITPIDAPDGYEAAFEISFQQPVDHNNPTGQQFMQKIFYSHKGYDQPTVIVINGYAATRNKISELASILDANQIIVSYRYSINSCPDPIDWTYLTLEQAANDHHRIVEAFKEIYWGKWIATGASKGGTDVACFKRFFPDDLDAVVAVTAPFPNSNADNRIDEFIYETVGTTDDRNKATTFQRLIIENQDAIKPMIQADMEKYGMPTPFDIDQIFWYSVLEYPFSFWQYGPGDCSIIPGAEASVETLFEHFAMVIPFFNFLQISYDYLSSSTYLMATEVGGYSFVTDHLQDLIDGSVQLPDTDMFAPAGIDIVFNPNVMQDIVNWLQVNGDNIIYIYGGVDPWTATAIETTGSTNSVKIIEPAANHMINLAGLAQSSLIASTLSEWLGLEVIIN